MDLRFLGKVLQGALIGLGAVLPGISGGVLSVVFGVYRPIMEFLSDPVHKWRTHLPELFPYMIGSAAGFLGVANLLSYVLETYPEPSVCVFVGLIVGMLPSLWREAGEQGRTVGNVILSCVTLVAMLSLLFWLQNSQNAVEPGLFKLFILRLCLCTVGDRSGHEFFNDIDAFGTVYALCGRDRSCETGGSASGSGRVRGDFYLSGKTGKPVV